MASTSGKGLAILAGARRLLERPPADWPAAPWALTAPETLLLLREPPWWVTRPNCRLRADWRRSHLLGPGRPPSALALLELVARGALRAVAVAPPGGRRLRDDQLAAVLRATRASATDEAWLRGRLRGGGWSLAPVARVDGAAASPPLAAVRREVEALLAAPGASADAPLRAVARRLDAAERGYVDRAVWPALVGRGLGVTAPGRLLGLLPVRRPAWTPAGRAALDELQRFLDRLADDLPTWAATDPPRALAFLGWAGAAGLLIGQLDAHLAPLHARLADLPPGAHLAGSGRKPAWMDLDPSALADLGALRRDLNLELARLHSD